MSSPFVRITTPLGAISKGIEGNATINFAPSSGSNCSRYCSHHADNGGTCYAYHTEGFKPSITVNLERKEADPEGYLSILLESKTNRAKLTQAPWVRFSAFGSIATPSKWSGIFRSRLSELAILLADQIQARRVHWPVETREKARALRAIGFPARLSLGGRNAPAHIMRTIEAEQMPVSISVTGHKKGKESQKAANIRASFLKAKRLRKKGLSVVVCPAITGDTKCGNCKACATDKVAVIVYPEH